MEEQEHQAKLQSVVQTFLETTKGVEEYKAVAETYKAAVLGVIVRFFSKN